MNQTDVSARVLSDLQAITVLKSVISGIGDTNASMPIEFPLAMYSVGEPQPAGWLTMGSVYGTYNVTIVIQLGTPEMLATDAEAVKLTCNDKVRAAFSQDPTLGGACLAAILTGATNNLATFRDQEDIPKLTYILTVQEYTLASSAGN